MFSFFLQLGIRGFWASAPKPYRTKALQAMRLENPEVITEDATSTFG